MKTKNKIIFSVLFFSLFFAFSAKAEIKTVSEELNGLTVSRIAPDSAYLGQKIWITFIFENNSAGQKTIALKENLGNADFDKTEAKNVVTDYGDKFWYYEWKIKLAGGGNTSVSYWLIPQKIGSYTISPSKITIDGKDFNLGSWDIEVQCLADEKCDLKGGENYLNCSYDCSTGLADNLCDAAKDNRCDPDCEKGLDLDCGKTIFKSDLIYFIVGGILLVLALLIIINLIFKKIKKKKINI